MTRAWVWRVLRERGNPSRALAKHDKASGGSSYSGGGSSVAEASGERRLRPKNLKTTRIGVERRKGGERVHLGLEFEREDGA